MLPDLLGAKKGAFKDYTELRAQVNTSRRVALLAGNMTANARTAEGGVSARVYRGGTFGFASGAEYSGESVDSILKAAADNAAFMDAHAGKGLPPLPAAPAGRGELLIPDRKSVV
jgi:TldD protein